MELRSLRVTAFGLGSAGQGAHPKLQEAQWVQRREMTPDLNSMPPSTARITAEGCRTWCAGQWRGPCACQGLMLGIVNCLSWYVGVQRYPDWTPGCCSSTPIVRPQHSLPQAVCPCRPNRLALTSRNSLKQASSLKGQQRS